MPFFRAIRFDGMFQGAVVPSHNNVYQTCVGTRGGRTEPYDFISSSAQLEISDRPLDILIRLDCVTNELVLPFDPVPGSLHEPGSSFEKTVSAQIDSMKPLTTHNRRFISWTWPAPGR